MSAILVIDFPDRSARWSLVVNGVIAHEGSLTGEGLEDAGSDTIDHAIVLIPSDQVHVTQKVIPGQESQARQAAPFLIEDDLASPLETTEVVAGPGFESGKRWIFAIAREQRDSLQEILLTLPVRPVYAVPEGLVIHGHDADLTMIEQDDRIIFQTRSGDVAARMERDPSGDEEAPANLYTGAFSSDHAQMVMPALGKAFKLERVLISEGIDPGLLVSDGQSVALKRIPTPDLRLNAAELNEAVLESLPGLLGPAFRYQLDWASLLRQWQRAMILAGAVMIAFVSLMVAQGFYYSGQASTFQDATDDLIYAEFPDIPPGQNAEIYFRQVMRTLNQASGGAGYLPLAADLAAIVEQTDILTIDSLRYDIGRDGIAVTARYANFDDFEVFRNAAQSAGLVIEDNGARQEGRQVSGDFLVRRP